MRAGNGIRKMRPAGLGEGRRPRTPLAPAPTQRPGPDAGELAGDQSTFWISPRAYITAQTTARVAITVERISLRRISRLPGPLA